MNVKQMILVSATLALAFGSVHASSDKASADTPGFSELDRNDDGSLSKAEARSHAALSARFAEVDGDGDGKLSRFEYLKAMARKDFTAIRENVADFIDPDTKASAGGSPGAP